MNFTGLEALLLSIVIGAISSLGTQWWMRKNYIRQEECIGMNIGARLDGIEAILRVIADRQGISQQELIEIEAQVRGRK